MQLFGKSAKIAISAAVVLASRPAGALTSAAEIATQTGDSPTYVAKVLQELARRGILASRKGAAGGFYLRKPPLEISLWDLVSPFEGHLDDEHCLIDGGKICGSDQRCGMHRTWARVSQDIIRTLHQTSLLDIHRQQEKASSFAV